MTMRHWIFALAVGALASGQPASSAGLADEIARAMGRQGFTNITIETTWLGRTRIIGTRNGGSREIILNPDTGEILRDLWLNAQGEVRAADIDFDDLDTSAADRLEDRAESRGEARDAVRDETDRMDGGAEGTGGERGLDRDRADD